MLRDDPTLDEPPYVADIHAQPASLQALLDAGLTPEVRTLLGDLGCFDRIVMTGMGASLFAQLPTWTRLVAAGLPAWNVETAELLGPAGRLVTPGTLLWVTSQSGASAEVEALLDRVVGTGTTVLGSTNDAGGPLARAADVVLELHAGDERTVSTRSYVNTLAAHALATDHALGDAPDTALLEAAGTLAAWLAGWDGHVAALDEAVTQPTVFVLGRGTSMAAVETGALIIKEAAKAAVEGMSAPQFRHGPFELADPDLATLVLAGGPDEQEANGRTVADLRALGAHALLAGGPDGDRAVAVPALTSARSLPLAEILPLQALSVVLAQRRGIEPGAFRQIGKVTRTL